MTDSVELSYRCFHLLQLFSFTEAPSTVPLCSPLETKCDRRVGDADKHGLMECTVRYDNWLCLWYDQYVEREREVPSEREAREGKSKQPTANVYAKSRDENKTIEYHNTSDNRQRIIPEYV